MTSNYPRLILWSALGLALWLNYQAWVRDYGPLPGATSAIERPAKPSATGAVPSFGTSVPTASSTSVQTGSKTAAGSAETARPASAAAHAAAQQAAEKFGSAAAAAPAVEVRTDVLDVRLSLTGGTIVRADLLKYPKVKGQLEPVQLENRASPDTLYVLQTGLTGPPGEPRPTHLAEFTSAQTRYSLAPGSDELRVPLTWTDGRGLTVTKTFIFRRGLYRIGLEQTVDNRSARPWQAAAYADVIRYDKPTHSSYFVFNADRYSFNGPAIYDGTKYRTLKISAAENQHLSLDVTGGWLAASQHDFVSAVIPPQGDPYRYTLNVDGNEFALTTAGPMRSVSPGSSASFDFKLFIGPTLQAQLEATAPHFDLVANYGRLTFLAKPLFWLLEKAHSVLGNWGLAIIAVTILLKLLLYPLSETSYRSMAKMKALAPRIKALQETYKGEKEKVSRAMMDLYKREKVNPVAGCLPMIIQIPIFFAYYYVLLGSVEMRQAPFYGWIHDLSSRDPYFILPGLMAIASFFQYKLNPAPADPTQAKVMMVMPFALSAMFALFPAGLVLYYLTNTLLGAAQQWSINRRMEAAAKRVKK
ncbi:MAG: membrane protein insertase YidC [Steroidobacteraceae bacterium]